MAYPTSTSETLADGTVHLLSLGFAIPASIFLMMHAAGQEGTLTATVIYAACILASFTASGVEAVVFFDPKKAWEFELRRKRGAHLFSKHRFLSAQMAGYLADGAWLETAKTANANAAHLAQGLRKADR